MVVDGAKRLPARTREVVDGGVVKTKAEEGLAKNKSHPKIYSAGSILKNAMVKLCPIEVSMENRHTIIKHVAQQ